MKAERLLPEEDKIKFILNDKVFYYTREEFRAYLEDLYAKNDMGLMDIGFERILENMSKYDGDPFGQFQGITRKLFHEDLEMGFLPIIS